MNTMSQYFNIVLRPLAKHDLIYEVPFSWFGLASFFIAGISKRLYDVNLNGETVVAYIGPAKYFLDSIFVFLILHFCCRLFKGVATLTLVFRVFSIASIPLIMGVVADLAFIFMAKNGSASSELAIGCLLVRTGMRAWCLFLTIALMRFAHRQAMSYFIYSVVLAFLVLVIAAIVEGYFFNPELWDIGFPGFPERYDK